MPEFHQDGNLHFMLDKAKEVVEDMICFVRKSHRQFGESKTRKRDELCQLGRARCSDNILSNRRCSHHQYTQVTGITTHKPSTTLTPAVVHVSSRRYSDCKQQSSCASATCLVQIFITHVDAGKNARRTDLETSLHPSDGQFIGGREIGQVDNNIKVVGYSVQQLNLSLILRRAWHPR